MNSVSTCDAEMPSDLDLRAGAPWLWTSALFVLAFAALVAGRLSTPAHISRAALEKQFPGQISRLRELACDPDRRNSSAEIYQADLRLFGQPAILDAYVESGSNPHLDVAGKHLDWSSRVGLPLNPGTPVQVSRCWYRLASGALVPAVAYESQALDKQGRRVGFALVAEISRLGR